MMNPVIDTGNLKHYDQLIKAVAGGSLTLSEDGAKLVLKSVDGNVLSEIDAPSSGGSGDAIPKTGDRGILAGFNTIDSLADPSGPVIINGSSNDDTIVTLMSGSADIRFEAGGAETWCKQVLVFNQGGTCSLSVPDTGMVLFDNLDVSYTPGMLDLFVYVWYGQIGIVYTKGLM